MSTNENSPVRSVGPNEIAAPRRRGWRRMSFNVPTPALLRVPPGIFSVGTGGSTVGAYFVHDINAHQAWMGIALTGIAVVGDSVRQWCHTYREVHAQTQVAAASVVIQKASEAI